MSEAAGNAVRTPQGTSDKADEPIAGSAPEKATTKVMPLSFSQQFTWDSLQVQMNTLIAEIAMQYGLDPAKVGHDFIINGKSIIFEVKQ